MFDLGFSEIFLVVVLGLVVLGPEKLPIAFKTISKWIKTLRELSQGVQFTLAQELKMNELQDEIQKLGHIAKSQLTQDDELGLKKEIDTLKATILSLQQQIETISQHETIPPVRSLPHSSEPIDLNEIEHELDEDLDYYQDLSETILPEELSTPYLEHHEAGMPSAERSQPTDQAPEIRTSAENVAKVEQ